MSTFLKKELIENNFLVEEITENVLLVKNFLSKEELDIYLNIINNTPEEDWHVEYERNLIDFCISKFGRGDVDNLVAEGKFEVTEGWKDKNLRISEQPITQQVSNKLRHIIKNANSTLQLNGLDLLQRMQDGTALQSHTDEHTDPSIKYATIVYLNDDYLGGEFFFKNKEIYIRPEPGSLLIFPGNAEFEHGVTPVEQGPIRYVLVGFIKEKDHYKNNRY
jgi:hypothetical protein